MFIWIFSLYLDNLHSKWYISGILEFWATTLLFTAMTPPLEIFELFAILYKKSQILPLIFRQIMVEMDYTFV